MKPKAAKDWRSILLAIVSTGGAILAVAMAIVVVVSNAAVNLLGDQEKVPLIDAVLIAAALLFIGGLLIPAAYLSFLRLMGEEVGADSPRPMNIPKGFLLIAIWVGVTALTQILYDDNILRWIAPPFYILSVGLPVYFFVLLTIGGLKAGSKQRTWGALGSGMILGPSLAASIELALVILLLIGMGIYLSFHPDLRITFNILREQLNNNSSPDDILNLLSPYLLNPIVIAIVLSFFSAIAPLVEETSKSLTTWIIFDHLATPAEGFVVGALSGAGFGLVESLLASVRPDSSWATTLFVRGGTTMMHIITASLTGWGIASFRVNKRLSRMIGTYALAMFLHGLWNACVVLIVAGSVHRVLNPQSTDIMGVGLIYFGAVILILITLGVPIALSSINWRLRPAAQTLPAAEGTEGMDIKGVK